MNVNRSHKEHDIQDTTTPLSHPDARSFVHFCCYAGTFDRIFATIHWFFSAERKKIVISAAQTLVKQQKA